MSTAPHPRTILFARGTLARLALWPALRLAVHESWGGPASASKQRWLAGVLVDQFETSVVASTVVVVPTNAPPSPSPSPSRSPAPPDALYIEDLLLQIMADEFDVVLEDDSAAAVAADLVRLFVGVCAGDDSFVNELEARAETVEGRMPKFERGAGSDESDSEWEDDDDDDDDDDDGEGGGEGEIGGENEGDHSEPRVDEDGFTTVTRKRRG